METTEDIIKAHSQEALLKEVVDLRYDTAF